MSPLNFASTILGGLTLLLSILSQVALWQLKEYRWDRMWSHLRSPQGSLLQYPLILLAFVAIFIGWGNYLLHIWGFTSQSLGEIGWVALLLFLFHHTLRIRKRGVLRPDFTIRAIATLILTTLLCLSIPYFAFHIQFFPALLWATAIFLTPALVALAAAAVGIPFKLRRRQIIAQAKTARKKFPNLTVVGITGSYGKTSTKHFLEHILKTAGKKVAATLAHHNTPIGVAQDIIEQVKPGLEVYIAELGAYRRGEIAELADIVQPTIGVITAISNQHLELFGSQENILKTKWELMQALPENGTAVLNADDPLIMKQPLTAGRKVLHYSTKRKADIWVEHVHFHPTTISCTLHIGDVIRGITIPLASEALLGSTLAACAAALAVGLSAEAIAPALETLQPFPRTMEIRAGKNNAQIIDDSYSGNEEGTIMAIRHLGRFRQSDKRIVLFPLIELGSESARVHRRIGEAARVAGAKLYVAGRAHEKELGPAVYESDPNRLATVASANLSEQSAVLLENRVPDVIRNAVLA